MDQTIGDRFPQLRALLPDDEPPEPVEQPPPNGQRKPRIWYCEQCGKEVMSVDAPLNWYILGRYLESRAAGIKNLGSYCSAECLLARLPRMAAHDRSFAHRREQEKGGR